MARPRRAATRLVGVLVVGFDTATPAVSVALHDGERVVSEASAADRRRHGELLTPMIAKVLADAGASRADLPVAGGQLYPEAFGEEPRPAKQVTPS